MLRSIDNKTIVRFQNLFHRSLESRVVRLLFLESLEVTHVEYLVQKRGKLLLQVDEVVEGVEYNHYFALQNMPQRRIDIMH